MVKEGDLLWTPTPETVANANVTSYTHWLERRTGLTFPDYDALWRWSVENLEAFWQSIWDYYEVDSSAPHACVLAEQGMPGARWFPGAKLNFAQHMLRQARPGVPALYYQSEQQPLATLSWDELATQVQVLATALRALGVQPGDRVVAYLPNIPEAAIALCATAAIGAVWSACSPDFGTQSVLDRFSQIEPKVLFCVDGYRYGGKDFDRREEVKRIAAQLPTLAQVIFLPYLHAEDSSPPVAGAISWRQLLARTTASVETFAYEPVDFDHPLWILYSSGTTGLPKPIVHGHGGITLELLKFMHLHVDLQPDDRMFFYTTTGWMVWNLLLSALMTGAAVILYDGNPAYPNPDVLWRIAAAAGATQFGASASYVQLMQKAGVVPKEHFDLSRLRTAMMSGSPATPESMAWFHANVKQDLCVASSSGGTDICSCFVSGIPTRPVYAGEIQVRDLGVDVHAFDAQGKKVIDEVGELVVLQPMPSMPLYFWNDAGKVRYLASYFEDYPGVWRHGDFFKVNARGGCYIYGRSDSTLNRFGVRIGTAEIYRSVETLTEVRDTLIVNLDLSGGRFFMPLFVVLAPGLTLTPELEQRIAHRLRDDCSPRHVPDRIYAIDAVPYTLTGKKMEVPVRKILSGVAPEQAASLDAMANPKAINWFVEYAKRQTDFTL
jgi:acetoacetyl-CoA synthetase